MEVDVLQSGWAVEVQQQTETAWVSGMAQSTKWKIIEAARHGGETASYLVFPVYSKVTSPQG
jgi:hypothetical protein